MQKESPSVLDKARPMSIMKLYLCIKKNMRRRIHLIFTVHTVIFFLFSLGFASAQEIKTAEQYFNAVSENYGTIEDYTAHITITKGETVLEGTIFYRSPNLLRINFSKPEDQVLVVNNKKLMLHLPQHHVVMQQEIKSNSEAALASMASEKGLILLKRSYSVAFLDSPNFVPLEKDSNEKVRKLKMEWRKPGQGFRQIIMSVNEDMLIRRMEGLTGEYERFQLDFTNIQLNQGIPNARFEFDSPPSAYRIDNFLFTPES